MNILNYIRSLVRKNTGLLVCLYLALSLPFMVSCGDEAELYEIGTEGSVSMQTNAAGGIEPDETLNADTDVSGDVSQATDVTENAEEKMLVVHLCGAVNNPGVYELEIDSRIIDGINKAGGFRDDAGKDALNLAMEITDGSRIYVPTQEEVEASGSEAYAVTPDNGGYVTAAGDTGEADTRVNINTADADKLTTLSGIGESRAKAIIAYREEHGGFKSVEELMNVSGIGKASFEKLKDDITI